MPVTEWLSFGAAATSGAGADWSSPANALTQDGATSAVDLSGGAAASDSLRLSALQSAGRPSVNATITGIEIRGRGGFTTFTSNLASSVSLTKDDFSTVGTANTLAYSESGIEDVSLGGEANMLNVPGGTLSGADLDAFGIQTQFLGQAILEVDYFQVRLYFDEPPRFLETAPSTLGRNPLRLPVNTALQLNQGSNLELTPNNTAIQQIHWQAVVHPNLDSWDDLTADTKLLPLFQFHGRHIGQHPTIRLPGHECWIKKESSTTARLLFLCMYEYDDAGTPTIVVYCAQSDTFTFDRRRLGVEAAFDTASGWSYRYGHAADGTTGPGAFTIGAWTVPSGGDLYSANTALQTMQTQDWSTFSGFCCAARNVTPTGLISHNATAARAFLGLDAGETVAAFPNITSNLSATSTDVDTDWDVDAEYLAIRRAAWDTPLDDAPWKSECVFVEGYGYPTDQGSSLSGGLDTGFQYAGSVAGNAGFVPLLISGGNALNTNTSKIAEASIQWRDTVERYFGDRRDYLLGVPYKTGSTAFTDLVRSSRSSRKNIAIFGDSQETIPGGNGERSMLRLVDNIDRAGLLGGTGITSVARVVGGSGGGWSFLRSESFSEKVYSTITVTAGSDIANALPAGTAVDDSGTYRLPLCETVADNGSANPFVVTFAPGGSFAFAGAAKTGDGDVIRGGKRMPNSGTFTIKVTFVGHTSTPASSAAFAVRGGSTENTRTGWTAAAGNVVASGAMTGTLSTSAGVCSSATFTFDADGSDYYHMGIYSGGGTGTGAVPVAVEVWHERSAGIAIAQFATGGDDMLLAVTNEGLASEANWDISGFVSAAGFDAGWINLGTNDSGRTNASPVGLIRDRMRSLIAGFRAGVPGAPFLIVEETPRRGWETPTGGGAPNETSRMSFRSAHVNIPVAKEGTARALDDCMYLNMYRKVIDRGTWHHSREEGDTTAPSGNPVETTGITDRLEDAVHYSPLGSIEWADDISSLLGIGSSSSVPQIAHLAAAASFAR